MVASTLERNTPEQSPPLTPEDEAWLNSFDCRDVFEAQPMAVSLDMTLDFSEGPGFFGHDEPKAKDTAAEYLSQGSGFFDLYDAVAKPSRIAPYDMAETPRPVQVQVEKNRPYTLRTHEGRRKLGSDLCRWAGVEPLSGEALEKAQAIEEARRATVVDEQDLLGTKINQLFTLMPEKLRETGRTALLATTLLATVVTGSNVVVSPEKPAEVQLTAENLPELIFSHEHIVVDASANQAVQDLLNETDQAQALVPAGNTFQSVPQPAKPQLLETIVKIANDGNKVTMSSVETAETPVESPAEVPVTAAGLGINIEFTDPAASAAVAGLLENAQDQLNLQIVSANEKGISLLVSAANVITAEAATPAVALAEVEAPAGSLENVNLEMIEDINGTDKQLIREVVAYLIEKQGLAPQGAAYLTGNLNKESNLNSNAPGGGLAQLQGARRLGMPTGLYEQLDFLFIEMDRDGGSPHLNKLLRDSQANVKAIERGLEDWERWGIEGDRFAYGAQILEAIQTPMPEVDSRLAHDLIDRESQEEIEGVDTVEVKGIRVSVEIALNVANLLQAADADGVDLSGSGFRTTQRQAELRVINGCRNVYTAPASSCRVPTAIPGRSMHEKGLALDLTHDGALIRSRRNDAFQWLKTNAEQFGLYNLPSEPWHWSINGR